MSALHVAFQVVRASPLSGCSSQSVAGDQVLLFTQSSGSCSNGERGRNVADSGALAGEDTQAYSWACLILCPLDHFVILEMELIHWCPGW
jgi:hypothetical protein